MEGITFEAIKLKAIINSFGGAIAYVILLVTNLSAPGFGCALLGAFIGVTLRKDKSTLLNIVIMTFVVALIGAWVSSIAITFIESLVLPEQAKLFPNGFVGLLCGYLAYDHENVIANIRRWFSRKSEGDSSPWGGGYGRGRDFKDFDDDFGGGR